MFLYGNMTQKIMYSKTDIVIFKLVILAGYGIIDINGDWVTELEKDGWKFYKNLGNGLILINNKEGYSYLDTETKSIEKIEGINCGNENVYFLDGKIYCLLDSGEILCRDLKSNEDTIINIHEG